MYRTTLKEIFSEKPVKMSMEEVAEFSKPQVYAVRDGDVVFYVGRSVDPFRRIIQHMGHEMQLPSELGKLILENQPASMEKKIVSHLLGKQSQTVGVRRE